MKYQYIADISKALTKVYCRDNGAVFITGTDVPDELIEDIATDIDAVTRLLKQFEWDFRSDNSDRFADGAKMPPELVTLETQLDTCRRICKTIAAKQTDDVARDAWLRRETVFVWWIHLLVDYYPDAQTTVAERAKYRNWKTPTVAATSTATATGEAHRPKGQLSDYLIGVTVDAFKDELSPKVQGKKATDIGKIIRKEIQSGRLSKKRGYITAFLRAFGLDNQNTVNGVCQYLRRRQQGMKIVDDDAV